MELRWIDWNRDKVAGHGVGSEEAEYVVLAARTPYPQRGLEGRWVVWGQTAAGRYLQVVYIYDDALAAFLIHARPLNETEKRRLRRSRR
jgi:uncharacterized DUF497 family protein